MKKLFVSFIIALTVASLLVSCKSLGDLALFTKAEYRLAGLSNFTVAGINVMQKRRVEDFGLTDGISLLSAFTQKKFTTAFTLALEAKTPENTSGSLLIKKLQWILVIDGKETINGLITQPIQLKNGVNTIPIVISLNLMEFFTDRNYDGLLQLALKLAGQQSNLQSITLRLKPTVATSVGDYEYPDYLDVTQNFTR
jgi:hypothetical protein